jgi:glycosyltransferase involved in cell wall biosynthesis
VTMLSVVMAVHNGEPHLRESVDSVLNQSFSDFEFIIVDDASTDATADILEGYARRDRRVSPAPKCDDARSLSEREPWLPGGER